MSPVCESEHKKDSLEIRPGNWLRKAGLPGEIVAQWDLVGGPIANDRQGQFQGAWIAPGHGQRACLYPGRAESPAGKIVIHKMRCSIFFAEENRKTPRHCWGRLQS
jgi:hypothetical protein